MSIDEVARHIRGVSPAFEIVNYARPSDGLDSVIGHSMFHHGTVLGATFDLDRAQAMGSRWPQLQLEGALAEVECPKPRADLVPEALVDVVAFTAEFLEAFGESLQAGNMILSGSYTATAVDLVDGTTIRGEYGAMGSISATARAAK